MADLKRPGATGLRGEMRPLGAVELRATGDNLPPKIGGYAAVFNSPATIGKWFVERIAPGAFANAIRTDDVRALYNHDPNYVIARTSNKTLILAEDAKGLVFEATPGETAWEKDLLAKIQRGDVTDMSFQFLAKREEWDETGDVPVRTLLEVELYDVSVVTFPAYDDTSVGMRSLEDWRAKQIIDRRAHNFRAAAMRIRLAKNLDLVQRTAR